MESSIANTSNDSNGNNDSLASRINSKKQQFTNKQRLDMYAFCVIELELNGESVSIKKRRQALKKALEAAVQNHPDNDDDKNKNTNNVQDGGNHQYIDANQQQNNTSQTHVLAPITDHHEQSSARIVIAVAPPSTSTALTTYTGNMGQQQLIPNQVSEISQQQQRQHQQQQHHHQHQHHHHQHQQQQQQQQQQHHHQQIQIQIQRQKGTHSAKANGKELLSRAEEESLGQLQQELQRTCKCYSDYQKTLVLTSSMLRDVQLRFAKYYPNSPIPSRTTIKHVFEKCVEHGTVENIKNRRKATKIAQGDEVEQLLEEEPQLSLRQMARKLRVSVGTISRRCRALGLIPESVTVKHQQLAIAKRQKQIKQHAKHPKP